VKARDLAYHDDTKTNFKVREIQKRREQGSIKPVLAWRYLIHEGTLKGVSSAVDTVKIVIFCSNVFTSSFNNRISLAV
jgi:hypothetical protein